MVKREIGIRLEEALGLKLWDQARIVAGQEGLQRVVKSINIMEVPDIERWVKEGELLLTTVFSMKDDLEAQQRLIPRLAERGLAGLAIKPGRYIEEIPAVMIQQADRYAFPLIELPYEASFSELADAILGMILNMQTVMIKKSLDTHEMLMNVVLKGGGLREISRNLASLVQSPLAIVNQNYELLSSDLLEELTEDQLFECRGKLAIARLKQEHQVGEKMVGRFQESQITGSEGQVLLQLSIPIMVGHECYGHIFVWEGERKLQEMDLMSIERAVTVAAMEMLNQQNLFEVERRYQNELLYDLLQGKFEQEDLLRSRANRLHWRLAGPFAVILFEFLEEADPEQDIRKNHLLRNQLIRGMSQICEQQADEVIFGDWGTRFLLLTSLPDEQVSLAEHLQPLLRELDQLLEQYQANYHIGVSSISPELMSVQNSFEEAKEAINVAKSTPSVGLIAYYDQLGVFRLLHKVDRQILQEFVEDTLGQLLRYDQENNTELVKTLDAYFANNGNLRKLAKELYVHYNTIIYRMERIQKILEVDLNQRNVRLNLEIALKIYGE